MSAARRLDGPLDNGGHRGNGGRRPTSVCTVERDLNRAWHAGLHGERRRLAPQTGDQIRGVQIDPRVEHTPVCGRIKSERDPQLVDAAFDQVPAASDRAGEMLALTKLIRIGPVLSIGVTCSTGSPGEEGAVVRFPHATNRSAALDTSSGTTAVNDARANECDDCHLR